MTLTELPDEGEDQEQIDSFTDSDEDAIGLDALNTINETFGTDLSLEDIGVIGIYTIEQGQPAFWLDYL